MYSSCGFRFDLLREDAADLFPALEVLPPSFFDPDADPETSCPLPDAVAGSLPWLWLWLLAEVLAPDRSAV